MRDIQKDRKLTNIYTAHALGGLNSLLSHVEDLEVLQSHSSVLSISSVIAKSIISP